MPLQHETPGPDPNLIDSSMILGMLYLRSYEMKEGLCQMEGKGHWPVNDVTGVSLLANQIDAGVVHSVGT